MAPYQLTVGGAAVEKDAEDGEAKLAVGKMLQPELCAGTME
jgi:hypothetical protein